MRRWKRPWLWIGGVLLAGAALLTAGALAWWWPAGPAPVPTAAPTAAAATTPPAAPTTLATAAVTVRPDPKSSLLITCNAPAALRLADTANRDVASGQCDRQQPWQVEELRRGTYVLRAVNQDLDVDLQQQISLYQAAQEVAVLFPGLLEIAPLPADATVEIDGTTYQGLTRVTYPAAQCPYTATVWVLANGHAPYGEKINVLAGQAQRREIALQAVPTQAPPTDATARPTRPPVTPGATATPFSAAERVTLVRQKLYDSVNCIRAENGLPPLPYLAEWQALADDFARGWRDHFLQYGPGGFDPASWRQQFQAAGGDAVTDNAGLVLYAPDYYVNTAPLARWESFDMCDPNCPLYHYFQERTSELLRASGVVVGLVPWWDGDVLKASVVIGVKW